MRLRCHLGVRLLAATAPAGAWKPHEVRQINGTAGDVRLPAQFQIGTGSWKRVGAGPDIVYMPEKDRLQLLVNLDYPHHAEGLFSDARGASPTTTGPSINPGVTPTDRADWTG